MDELRACQWGSQNCITQTTMSGVAQFHVIARDFVSETRVDLIRLGGICMTEPRLANASWMHNAGRAALGSQKTPLPGSFQARLGKRILCSLAPTSQQEFLSLSRPN